MQFFSKTPKCTDEREQAMLKEFIGKYWTFGAFPKVEETAAVALRLIKDDPEALGKLTEKDFLKLYDECKFKFSEMSKAVEKIETNDSTI